MNDEERCGNCEHNKYKFFFGHDKKYCYAMRIIMTNEYCKKEKECAYWEKTRSIHSKEIKTKKII